MRRNKYTLDDLVETFARHSGQFDCTYISPSEGDEESFNLPEALLSIVKEIKHLKDRE